MVFCTERYKEAVKDAIFNEENHELEWLQHADDTDTVVQTIEPKDQVQDKTCAEQTIEDGLKQLGTQFMQELHGQVESNDAVCNLSKKDAAGWKQFCQIIATEQFRVEVLKAINAALGRF